MNVTTTSVEANPYSPPQARVADVDQPAEGLLYVVAPRKFLILMIGTAGLYTFYWFYKNWSLLNRKDQAYWPVPRAIFAIFFTHALFGEVDGLLQRQGRSKDYSWSPGGLATTYVISAISGSVLGRLSVYGFGSPLLIVSLQQVVFVLTICVIYRAQRAINYAEDDAQGLRNKELTLANFGWLALGAVFWLLKFAGLFFILSGRALR